MTSILQSRRGRDQSSRHIGASIFLLLFAAGCGSKGAVSLSARLERAELSVEPAVFGASLSGSFDLVLELGDAAPRATTVGLGSFAIKRDETLVVETLDAEVSESFPIELEPGGSATLAFTFEQLESADGLATELCSAPIWISGSVNDTLSDGRPTPASSARFDAVCP